MFLRPVLLAISLLLPAGAARQDDPLVEAGLTVSTTAGVKQTSMGRRDMPRVYANGCHVSFGSAEPRVCRVGSGARKIAVMGDSHAAAMYGAFSTWAKKSGWTFLTVTKHGCPMVDVRSASTAPAALGKHLPYTSCYAWRKKAAAKVGREKPDLIVLPLLSRRELLGGGGLSEWERAIVRTVELLSATAPVLVIGDDPRSVVDVPKCLLSHPKAVQACTTPWSKAVFRERLDAERRAAIKGGAVFYDQTGWYCTKKGCPAIIGGVVVRRDDNHITDTFSRHLGEKLADVVAEALSKRGIGLTAGGS